MIDRTTGSTESTQRGAVLRGAVVIVLAGVALGITFNWLGLQSKAGWGVPWIAADRVAEMPSLGDVSPAGEAGSTADPSTEVYTDIDDPMAVGLGQPATDLPEIPVLDRPIQIELESAKQLFDAGAALFVDAREPEEFEAGHMTGAINVPYEEASSAPERLEAIDSGGRPIIVYCGGGTCEVSIDLAWELIYAGHGRVVVFMGGYPEWFEAGFPTTAGTEGGW